MIRIKQLSSNKVPAFTFSGAWIVINKGIKLTEKYHLRISEPPPPQKKHSKEQFLAKIMKQPRTIETYQETLINFKNNDKIKTILNMRK